MSEQNPYAPVGSQGTIPPPDFGGMSPQGFGPPPAEGYAPPAQGFAPPPGGFAPAPMQYDNPAMTLTELSFAPIPSDEPPAAAEPPPAVPGLVSNVLPSGGAARRLSLGGRTPLIALVLLLLAGAAGVYFFTGIFKTKEEPAPVVPPKKAQAPAPAVVVPSTPALVAPVVPAPAAKPAAKKPPVKPLIGKPLSVTKANSRTFGSAYTLTVPTGFTSKLNAGRSELGSNRDVRLTSKATNQVLSVDTVIQDDPGPIGTDHLENISAEFLLANPKAKILPGEVKATVAGIAAFGFDFTTVVEGQKQTGRVVVMARKGGVAYAMKWVTTSAQFSLSLPTFNQILATVKFAK